MWRSTLTLTLGLAIGTFGIARPDHGSQEKIKPISSRDISEKLEGHDSRVTVVEVSLAPGANGSPHRHPGPVFGYVLEGIYELGIDDQPTKIYQQGETFYEPTGCLHRVSRNPSQKISTRLLATIVHPRTAEAIVLPSGHE